MKIRSLALASLFVVSIVSARAQFASSVIDYNPGTGFAAGYTNASAVLGTPVWGAAVTPFAAPYAKSQLVSIGAGGDITLQMSTPITDNPADPYGINFILFANQFFINSSSGVSGLYDHAASILVQVSPNDSTWYTLNPSVAPQPGALYPTYGSGNPLLPVNPSLTLANFMGQNPAGVESLYAGSAGGTGYDLSWAEDANSNSVDVASADYVRIEVQSGVLDLNAIAAVPEPAVWSFIFMGPALFWLLRRAKNQKTTASLPVWASLILLAGVLVVPSAKADTITENFAVNPLQNGWNIFGQTNLFTWDSTHLVEDVTWDSSQPDSFLYRPLGTILAIDDNFSLSFDLQIFDATGYNYSMQLAVDLFHFTDATNDVYSHADGTLPNVFEFGYFPGTDEVSPSLDATLIDSNADYYFAYDNQTLNPGVTYSVTITHVAGSSTVTGQVLADGEPFSTLPIVYAEPISDFRLDTLSLSSFQDDGFGDSILAHGSVENIVVTLPPPPVRQLGGYFTNGLWATTFLCQSNWFYSLQRSSDLQNWTTVNPDNAGNGTNLVLFDTNPRTTNAFYRILAERP
jgi:hypothetical protein